MNSANRPDIFSELWRRVQEHPARAAFVILLVTFLIALTGQTWVWFVGAVLVLIVLYPSLFNLGAGRGSTSGTTVTPPVPVPPRHDINQLHGRYRELMQRALDAQRNIETAVNQTHDPGQRKVLLDATSELPELTGSIYGLAAKAQGVEAALGGANPLNRLTAETKELEQQIMSTNVEFQKSQYYAALDGKLQQMQNITDATVALGRWNSQIENALSTMDTLLSQVLRIKSSEVLSYSGATDDLSNSLKREVDSLKAAAEAMDTVYGWK